MKDHCENDKFSSSAGGFAIGGGIALTVFVIVVAAVAYFAFKRIKKRQGRNAVPKEDQRFVHWIINMKHLKNTNPCTTM